MEKRPRLDVVGSVLSALGLALIVFGVLRAGSGDGSSRRKAGRSGPTSRPRCGLDAGPLLFVPDPLPPSAPGGKGRAGVTKGRWAGIRQLTGGLTMFFFQYLVQAGFRRAALPVDLPGPDRARDRSQAVAPSRSRSLLVLGIPRFFLHRPPRLVVRGGLLALLAGAIVLLAGLDADAGPEVVFVPMLLIA